MARKPKILEIPARMNAPDSGIDVSEFRQKLTHIETTSANVRDEALELFKTTLSIAKNSARERFEAGRPCQPRLRVSVGCLLYTSPSPRD